MSQENSGRVRQHALQRRDGAEEEHEGGQKMAPPPFQLFANPAEPPLDSPPTSNETGMPDHLKSGVEQLSGMDMGDVKVHYNSEKPAQLQAHAYAQGSDIHIAPGQEQHLAHEAWHVAQQKQGRVAPTIQAKGVDINDDSRLESEADEMGAKALQLQSVSPSPKKQVAGSPKTAQKVAQRQLKVDVTRARSSDEEDVEVADIGYAEGSPLLEFANLMKEDAGAIVKPATTATPSQKGPKMKEKLGSIPLDASALKEAFVGKLLQGSDWLHTDETTLSKIKKAVQAQLDEGDMAESGYDVENEEQDWDDISGDPDTYSINLQDALAGAIGTALDGVTKVGDMAVLGFNEEWSRVLAFSAYELTRASFYAETLAPGEAQPFIQLIQDINDDNVTELEFVEKYNSAGAGLGAEFKVSAPDDLATKYDGVAVVHTHYATNADQPHYGHTKPFARRKEKGYGYTKVDVGTLNGMDDTQKTYNAL